VNSGDTTPNSADGAASSGDGSSNHLQPLGDLPENYLEVEMPRRFILEFQTDDGEWMAGGHILGVSSSVFRTAATSAAPTPHQC
jgi:hypothetical protein